jgi:hypothetical protein
MKKSWILLIAIALVMVGCSQDGKLKVYNETLSDVWFTLDDGSQITLDVDEYYSKSWSLASSIFGNEEKDVDIAYNGYHVFSGEAGVTVEAGGSKSFKIYADGGAIAIWNNSSAFYIEELYISPSSSSSWGSNLLYYDIDPQEISTWTVTPDYWDIQLVDDWGDVFESYYNWISLDETTIFEYTGFKKADHVAGGEKIDHTAMPSRGEARIEANK